MKKLIFTLGLMFAFNVKAYEGIISQSGTCGETDADCHYDLYNDGHLEISGSGKMRDYSNLLSEQSGNPPTPWGTDIKSVSVRGISQIGEYAFSYAPNLENVSISNSVTTIRGAAFQNSSNLETIKLPDYLTDIGGWAFYGTKLNAIEIPSSVSFIGQSAFSGTNISAIVLPSALFENNALGFENGASSVFFNTSVVTIYCPADNTACQQTDFTHRKKSSYASVAPEISLFVQEDGVFQLVNEEGFKTGSLYLSANDMINDTNTCGTDLDVCKAMVLKNKGLCKNLSYDCKDFVDSANDGKILKVGSKTYQSLDDLLKGNYDVHRIYTIEEANAVAGDKNRVSIRYR